MKKITFLFTFLVASIGFSQSLPLDFEVPEDDAFSGFNGTVASVVVDPTDSANKVLSLVGANADFDGASIGLDTFIDLSDDSNNTISMDIWTPDAGPRTHLLKLEGGSSGAIESYFTTTASGWQTVNIDFGAALGNEYPTLVIFTDAGVGNNATGTYYIDNINGPNGATVGADPVPSGPAPDPTASDSDVLSIYSDTGGFTNIWSSDYQFGTDAGQVDLGSGVTNNARKFNLQAAGYGEGTNTVTDITLATSVEFDYWADANSTEFKLFLIDNDGAVEEFTYTISSSGGDETIVNETWTHVSIPMTYFTALGFNKANFFQWKIDASSNLVSEIIYIDNLFFQGPSLDNDKFSLTDFNVYPNPTNNNWNIKIQNTVINTVQVFDVLGKQVLRLSPNASEVKIDASNLNKGLYFAKINTALGSKSIKLVKN